MNELIAYYEEMKLTPLVGYLLEHYYDPLYTKNRKIEAPFKGAYQTDDMERCVSEFEQDFLKEV